MSLEAWLSLLVVGLLFAVLQFRRAPSTDILFLGGLVAVVAMGIISPATALAGFANPAVLMIAALFVVAAGLRLTGVLDLIGSRLLGSAQTAGGAIARLSCVVLSLSAFVNNTPVVAMFVPMLVDWCRKRGVSPSRVLIPLSYLAIMGGTCSLIGTSTNIVVNGLLQAEQRVDDANKLYSEPFCRQLDGMRLFEIGRVGVPCAAVGALYLLIFGPRLLPKRRGLIERLNEQRREYMVELLVTSDCRLIGKTVVDADLRQLRGLFLIEIDRGDDVITPVTPSDVIQSGDRLVFTGVVTTIVDLVKIPGLVPASDSQDVGAPRRRRSRWLFEAVISKSSPLIGTSIRKAGFRQRYNAAVVAVHRNGARLPSKVGDIVIEPGDTLLLQTRTGFVERHRHNPDFYLVAGVDDSQPQEHERAWIAVALVVGLIIWLALGSMIFSCSMAALAIASLAVAGLMVVTRCVSVADARKAVDLQVLVTIAAALGLGRALTESGVAQSIAAVLVDLVGSAHPYLLLAVLYLLAIIFTELITNVAVAAMLFPLAVAMAAASGLSPRPFVMAIAMAASMSFVTPIGYQTNLMVMGPGGYKPRDYMRVGLPLTVLVSGVALLLIPRIWPFAL
ncbi:MAG: SLC13 family permease [Planctomycetota bacterium]|nr:SLC13 family permease [Planctomycetota bacterium]